MHAGLALQLLRRRLLKLVALFMLVSYQRVTDVRQSLLYRASHT